MARAQSSRILPHVPFTIPKRNPTTYGLVTLLGFTADEYFLVKNLVRDF